MKPLNLSELKRLPLWQKLYGYRNTIIVTIGVFFVGYSVFVTNKMVATLRDKEVYEVELWVAAMEKMSHDVGINDIPTSLDIANARQNIPFFVLDESMKVVISHLIGDDIASNPDQLRRYIREFSKVNHPVEFQSMWGGERYYLLYGTSELLSRLFYVPIIQTMLLLIFFAIAFIALRSTKQGEQDRVWVGLAKETAHQLGTPISSLMGWIDYLRDQGVESEAVEEMSSDLAHLMKVTDRFSKIGADTQLTPTSVNEVVGEVVDYFGGRLPRGVTLRYDGLSQAPAMANLNGILFAWVIENLMKNALDAMQGSGEIDVKLSANENNVMVDVRDTGRGISKGAWRRIFNPGYTTKSRGWGLGLSLSRRIVEEYHYGKISVVASELGVGTTIRIIVKRIFDEA
ncbi:MAG: HAMP domain-containing sensor histidine kinase [Rikenellaceae bacterium]